MIFWDTSAIVPLLAREPSTPRLQKRYGSDGAVVWWGTVVECASAIARLERDGGFEADQSAEAFARLDLLRRSWVEIVPGDAVRDAARRLLRVHPLRAADALQLAAAWLASEQQPATLPIMTLDLRLADAARREGFTVLDDRA